MSSFSFSSRFVLGIRLESPWFFSLSLSHRVSRRVWWRSFSLSLFPSWSVSRPSERLPVLSLFASPRVVCLHADGLFPDEWLRLAWEYQTLAEQMMRCQTWRGGCDYPEGLLACVTEQVLYLRKRLEVGARSPPPPPSPPMQTHAGRPPLGCTLGQRSLLPCSLCLSLSLSFCLLSLRVRPHYRWYKFGTSVSAPLGNERTAGKRVRVSSLG